MENKQTVATLTDLLGLMFWFIVGLSGLVWFVFGALSHDATAAVVGGIGVLFADRRIDK